MMVHRGHAETDLRLVRRTAADKPYALWILSAVAFRGKLVLSDSSRRDADADVAGAAEARLALCDGLHDRLGARRRLLGYAIGALLYDSIGHWLIQLYGLGDKVEAFRESYARWGAVIILLKGLTPIPYKLVTITSGFAGYNIVAVHLLLDHHARRALLRRGAADEPLWRLDQGEGRAASRRCLPRFSSLGAGRWASSSPLS